MIQGEIDLIKTVRGLDQSGPGDKAEKLDQLWSSLTASPDEQFHAAEESTLRWLLKSMNGSSPAAETIRRYPLTWRILSCVFERIPLFPLAKSLVDRRFFSVLQQAVTDVSTPSDEPTASSGKRKRSSSPSFSIEILRTPGACIESGQAMFAALRSLLRRVDDTAVTLARDRTGAEHLKLILGTSASEAISIVAPLLRVCNLLLVQGQAEDVEGSERWINDISSLWTLHLQGEDDTNEIAKHVFIPVATLLHKLEGLQDDQDLSVPKGLKERWNADLQSFMHRSFIFPARSAFLNRQDPGPVFLALSGPDISPELSEDLPQTAPALYLLASSATEALVQSGIRKGNAEWMKKVFQLVEETMNRRGDRVAIMNNILRQARRRSMPVDTESLQSVCRDYGLNETETDWTLIANLTQCDPDVFHKGNAGSQLLEDVCNQSLKDEVEEKDYAAITEVLAAVARGFRSARDFSSFLRLWYLRLAEIEKREAGAAAPWQSLGSEVHLWIEQSLSVRQLVELLEWVADQKIRAGALCLWLSTVCDGISSAAFTDAAGQKVFDLVLNVKKSSTRHTSLKWRIIGKAVQWAPISEQEEEGKQEKLEENWEKVSDAVKKILKKGPLDSPETFEAFKCASTLWVHISPDGSLMKDVGKMVKKFDERLATEASKLKQPNTVTPLTQRLDKLLDSDFEPESAVANYMAWFFRGSTRLNRFIFEQTGELPLFVRHVLFETPVFDTGLQVLWDDLLDNEQCIGNGKLAEKAVDRLIEGVSSLRKSPKWLESGGVELLRSISRIPLDSISRAEREKLMVILVNSATSSKEGKKASLDTWRTILSLGTRLMSRPTFYEGMSVDHLSQLAESAVAAASKPHVTQEALLELIERYDSFASATISLLAGTVDERSLSYFKGAQQYVGRAMDGKKPTPLQHSLLKALRAGLSESNLLKQEQIASLLAKTEEALESGVYFVIDSWTSDKKLFTKPDSAEDLGLFAAIGASESLTEISTLKKLKSSSLKKLEQRSLEAMREDDIRGWKIQTFLQRFLSTELDIPRPASFHTLRDGRESLMKDYVGAIVKSIDAPLMMMYLEALLGEYAAGSETNGQLVAIQYVVDKLIGKF